MITERCVECGLKITGATRKRFEQRYDQHQKRSHGKPSLPGGFA